MIELPTYALSVRQPWAWAIIFGGKDTENRTKAAVKHGLSVGQVAIHAAKGMTRNEYESARGFMARLGVECPRPDDLIRGAILGTVDVVDVVDQSDSPWFSGPCGLVLENPKSYFPRPCSGQLGYFKWQERPSKHLQKPLKWMREWPQESGRKMPDATTTPLFGDNPLPLLNSSGMPDAQGDHARTTGRGDHKTRN